MVVIESVFSLFKTSYCANVNKYMPIKAINKKINNQRC